MLLTLAVTAIVGVVALGLLANRYAKLQQPLRSVAEVLAEPDPQPRMETPVGADEPAAAGEPASSVPDPPAAAPPAGAAPPSAEAGPDLTLVDRFLPVRRYVKTYLAEHPFAARQFELEFRSLLRTEDRKPTFPERLVELKTGRGRALLEAGMTEQEYRRIRDAFRAWHDGSKDVDPGLAGAFEKRRAELEAVHLGILEPLDDM
jgi:hypothetical protein